MKKYYSISIFLLFIFFSAKISAQNIDIDIVKLLNTNQTGFKTDYCKLFGKSVTFLSVGTPATVLVIGLIKKDKKMTLDAAFMTGAFVMSSLITYSSKKIFKHTRPYEKYPFITKLSSGGGYAFPSGHTSAAFTAATSLCLYFPKWYVVTPACIWATSVAMARMYQGVHYPKDIFAGAAIGISSAWLSSRIQKWVDKKRK